MSRIIDSSEVFYQQQPTTSLQPNPPLLCPPVDPPTSSISHLNKQQQNQPNQPSRPELTSAVTKAEAAPQPITQAQHKPKLMNDPKSPLHSILKKPTSAQPEHHKTTRLLLERPDGTNVERSPSTAPTPCPDEAAAKPGPEGRQTTQKKPHFFLFRGARNTHRRPVILRRKTTHTTIPRAASPPRPRLNQSQPVIPYPFKALDKDIVMQQIHQDMESSDEDVTESCPGSYPFDTPAPLSRQSTESTTPPETSSFIDALRESRRPFIHPSVHVPIHNHDFALPRETKKVRPVSQSFNINIYDEDLKVEQHISPHVHEAYHTTKPEGTYVPGFTNAKRIPMPKTMMNDLVSIITNPHPVQGNITVPSQPWVWSEGIWHKPTGEQPLHDWMIRDESLAQNPQPSDKRLVAQGFRKKFAERQAGIVFVDDQEGLATAFNQKRKHGRKMKHGHGESGSSAPVVDSSCREGEISHQPAG